MLPFANFILDTTFTLFRRMLRVETGELDTVIDYFCEVAHARAAMIAK